jgi:hypothetical protein
MVKVLEMAALPAEELARIVKQGAILRLPYLEGRLLQAREHIKGFTEQYETTLHDLRAQGLPENAGYAMHEDFIEWEYWSDVLQETESIVKNVKALLEKLEEAGDVR